MLMQIAPPPRFCHIGTKMSVLWRSKYAKIRFRPGLCLGPRWGSSRRSPRPLSRLERGHPSQAPPHLAQTHLWRSPCVPPQKSSQIYAYGTKTRIQVVLVYSVLKTKTNIDTRRGEYLDRDKNQFSDVQGEDKTNSEKPVSRQRLKSQKLHA